MRAAFFLFLAMLLVPLPALAQPRHGGEGVQPLDRLLPEIRRTHPGRIYDAEGPTPGGDPHYHLKWMTPDGRIEWLDTDARTGRVMGSSPGRDMFDGPRTQRFAPDDGPDRGYGGGGGYAPRFDSGPSSRYDRPRYGDGDTYGAPRSGGGRGWGPWRERGGRGNRGRGR